MLLKSCLDCEYHEITDEPMGRGSLCLKENCYSRYSTCIAQKTFDRFLNGESPQKGRPLSALTDLYRWEWKPAN